MITIRLKGGLGNQMFQYAYGRSLSLLKNESLRLDLSDIVFPVHLRKKETPREYKLNHFNILAEVYIPKKNRRLKQFVRKIYEWAIKKERSYQSEIYFRDISDIIKKDFSLKKPFNGKALQIQHQIESSLNPVSLHIRRCDYVTDAPTAKHHGALPIEYYNKAMLEMKKGKPDPTYFVFSDDIVWAKQNLGLPPQFIYVSDKDIEDYEEIILMSKCHHNIIANSSFSWWGAWLNPNKDKKVIAPEKWLADNKHGTKNIIPENWICI